MAKLLEKNASEMASALIAIAGPMQSFMDDPEFMKAFATCKNGDMLKVYTVIVPHLLGKKHFKDTLKILSIIEGVSVDKLMKMNGTELIADAFEAWNGQIKPFFTQLGLSASKR